ncbi:hypothetical protein J2Y48_003118 [Mycoplana sp. BE70]|uniref:hypothetical protein n=1 Tax=Mycoplana sp. BE70 TaxID=2817775 RepID=UPI00286089EA|nr:hypothetical protein [Mycoplana sp. BE70]MDR6757821.1 hypothetical protein [Mycoplana sp. BE70]
MRRGAPRTLYVIAPSMIECVETARAFGLAPAEMEHHRNITCAYSLRDTLPGTPFIAKPVSDWLPGPNTDVLALAVKAMQLQGRLRIMGAQEAPLYQTFSDMPRREMRG